MDKIVSKSKKMGKFFQGSHLLLVAMTYLFLYVPIVVLLLFSFNIERFPAPWKGFTWKWYVELFQSLYLWKAFVNSLIVATCSTCISLVAGVLLIFYAAQGGRVGKFLGLFYGTIIVPETILAVALLTFFTSLNVPLGMATLILAHSVLGLGYVIPMVYAKFLELDYRLTEASLVLGATPMQTFRKITLPMLSPTLVLIGLLVFILSFDEFILAYFTAGSAGQTLPLYLMSMLRTGVSPVVNALSAILLLMSSIFVLIFFSLKARVKILGYDNE